MKEDSIVRILWADSAVAPGGWEDVGNFADWTVADVESIGRIIDEDSNRIVIASHFSGTGEVSGAVSIPRSAIRVMERLRKR